MQDQPCDNPVASTSDDQAATGTDKKVPESKLKLHQSKAGQENVNFICKYCDKVFSVMILLG